ncbi:hypothetical protein [Pasteurella atlantica]|uniref:hypothetical protein n=1 Tax=Pasteurellaceae TaxID=712 RepID=UPI00275B6C3F|nr:hypothetical protein [Pasteurella atlantica]MDP8100099.1 hypothetical protein [Pasteurella atlantica]MDP8106226.1 hypothetical protein [Pasteurella atlantica]MDP8115955.1 hypothetical protein [Pasteurella atlantica]
MGNIAEGYVGVSVGKMAKNLTKIKQGKKIIHDNGAVVQSEKPMQNNSAVLQGEATIPASEVLPQNTTATLSRPITLSNGKELPAGTIVVNNGNANKATLPDGTTIKWNGAKVTEQKLLADAPELNSNVNTLPKLSEKIGLNTFLKSKNLTTEHITSKNVKIQRVEGGTLEQAIKDFDSLSFNNTQIVGEGKVKIGYLPDGSTVKLRPSNDGGRNRPTIEIIKPNGKTAREIRYGNPN